MAVSRMLFDSLAFFYSIQLSVIYVHKFVYFFFSLSRSQYIFNPTLTVNGVFYYCNRVHANSSPTIIVHTTVVGILVGHALLNRSQTTVSTFDHYTVYWTKKNISKSIMMANKPIVYENPLDTCTHSIVVEGLRSANRGVTANAVTSRYRIWGFNATYYVLCTSKRKKITFP